MSKYDLNVPEEGVVYLVAVRVGTSEVDRETYACVRATIPEAERALVEFAAEAAGIQCSDYEAAVAYLRATGADHEIKRLALGTEFEALEFE